MKSSSSSSSSSPAPPGVLNMLSYASDSDSNDGDNSDDDDIASQVQKKQTNFAKVEMDILAECEDLEKNYEMRERLWKNGSENNGAAHSEASNHSHLIESTATMKKPRERKTSEISSSRSQERK